MSNSEVHKRVVFWATLLSVVLASACHTPPHDTARANGEASVALDDKNVGDKAGRVRFKAIASCAKHLRTVGYETLEREQRLTPECRLLISSLEALDCRFDTTLSFVDDTFFVQRKGDMRRVSAVLAKSRTLLFVTDSIPELSGDALAFLSSLSPNSMAILAIDRDLRCRLIYDSSCKNDLLRDQETSLDAVGAVEWDGDGRFLLRERRVPSMNRAAFSPRVFELSIDSRGGFALKEKL